MTAEPVSLPRRRFDTTGNSMMRAACTLAAIISSMLGDGVTAQYRVIIEQDEDGLFVAEVPSLPGCVSQGHTRTEAIADIKDAIAGYLASPRERGEAVPPGLSEEFVEVM